MTCMCSSLVCCAAVWVLPFFCALMLRHRYFMKRMRGRDSRCWTSRNSQWQGGRRGEEEHGGGKRGGEEEDMGGGGEWEPSCRMYDCYTVWYIHVYHSRAPAYASSQHCLYLYIYVLYCLNHTVMLQCVCVSVCVCVCVCLSLCVCVCVCVCVMYVCV